ncbi:MAG TPA: FMN-binding protein [Pseudolysinimonas sp.]
MLTRHTRALAVGVAGLGLMGALSGCATSAADAVGSGISGPFTDGSYNADGSYLSPAGEQTVTVALTLAHDKITAITVTPHATDPTAKEYQAMFVQGIAALAVGKDISLLSITHVAGSSLTSGGFRKAIEAIETDAKG